MTVMLNLLVVFGRNCAVCWNVGLHFQLLTILKQMDSLSDFIAVSSRYYVVIVLVCRIVGVLFLLNANLH